MSTKLTKAQVAVLTAAAAAPHGAVDYYDVSRRGANARTCLALVELGFLTRSVSAEGWKVWVITVPGRAALSSASKPGER